jgi:tRNA modification GTPase
VLDVSEPSNAEDSKILQSIQDKPKILVLNKADQPQKLDVSALPDFVHQTSVRISCTQGTGLDELINQIYRIATQGLPIAEEGLVHTPRQKTLFENILENLQRAQKSCLEGLSPEFASADVRRALESLAELVGEVTNDEVLDRLFSQFCIGK